MQGKKKRKGEEYETWREKEKEKKKQSLKEN